MLPWNRIRLATEKVILGLLGRIEQLETGPAPDAWRDPFSALQREQGARIDAEHRLGQALKELAGEVDSLASQVVELAGLPVAVERLEGRDKQITLAVAEGIEKVERAERRVGATIARAQKKLKDLGYTDPGLEAEADQLRLVDAGGGDESELPELPPEVGADQETPSSVPGVSAAQLARVRGI